MNDQQEIIKLREELKSQSAQITSLENAGKRAGAITAIVGLCATLAGLVVGAFGYYYSIRSEFEVWELVRDQHHRSETGGDLYDHRGLEGHDIASALTQLGYPAAGDVVVRAELPTEIDLTEFVRNSDLADYVTYSELPNFDAFIKTEEEFRLKLRDTVTDHYVNMWTDGGLVYLTAQPTGQFFEVVK